MRIAARVNATASIINGVQTPYVSPLGSQLCDVYYKDNRTGTPSTITWNSATSTIEVGLGADVSISMISAGATPLSGYTLLASSVSKIGFKMSTAGGLVEVMHLEMDEADDGISNREAVCSLISTYNSQVITNLFQMLLGAGVSNGLLTVLAAGNDELLHAIENIEIELPGKGTYTFKRKS